MSKFRPGDKVAYNGKLKDIMPERSLMTVQAIVKDGQMLPNGQEKNLSGKTLVVVKGAYSSTNYVYAEDSLIGETELLREEYEATCKKYKTVLLKRIKDAVADLTKQNKTKCLNVEEAYVDGAYDRICKYCTPKDYPGNFCLSVFKIKDKKLVVTGLDIDEDSEWDFSEYDLEAEELAAIDTLMDDIYESIENGEYVIDSNGNLITP